MATALCVYRLTAVCRRGWPTAHRNAGGSMATFTTSPWRQDRKLEDIFPKVRRAPGISPEDYAQIESFVEKDLADPEIKDDEDKLREMLLDKQEIEEEEEEDADLDEGLSQKWEDAFDSYGMKKFDLPEKRKKLKQTFMNMGDPEPWEEDGMLPDDEDDITSLGHGELEQHREMRHYARLAAWEMPLLYKLRKPYNPPSKEMPLRFRYTTYMGEQHPAENKVVLEFCPEDLPDLTDEQRIKLKKLAGVRWNPEKDIVKISCESYETQAQNKRYIGDVLASLLKEARDSTDTMKDIPLYTKHHYFKKIPQFPKEWAMSVNRQKELKKYWKKQSLTDVRLEKQGLLVDGTENVQRALEATDKIMSYEVAPKSVGATKIAIKR